MAFTDPVLLKVFETVRRPETTRLLARASATATRSPIFLVFFNVPYLPCYELEIYHWTS